MRMARRVNWGAVMLGLAAAAGIFLIGGYEKAVQAETLSEPSANTGEDLIKAL
jgi:hypothetical protein